MIIPAYIAVAVAQQPNGLLPIQNRLPDQQVAGNVSSRYLLNSSDVVELKFSYNSDMNERVTIRPDGYLSLAMVGDIEARGKSPEALANDVKARYEGILKHPEVVVVVREFAAQRVFIAGEVNAPGVLPLAGRLTLAQALFHAGGAKPSAQLNQVLLLRYQGSNHTSVQVVRMSTIFKGSQPDVALEPYDVIFVPRSKVAKVGAFVEQYINDLVPRSLLFPYNINNVLNVRQ